ncbi:hypothetical protein MBLNU230_g1841t1 [Neophaeotheca triangularis]
MLVSLTVGKVDAGVAVLLTEDKRLIEFPSILLPPDIHSGSIVDINVARNQPAEITADQSFTQLQDEIYDLFGSSSPAPPVLRCRNATQTAVVLEWDPLELATAELRSLSLYRNGAKVGVIPRDKQSTKISGLAVGTEYTFHLVLRTSAGVYSSEKVVIKTHQMTDLTGVTITPGIMPDQLRDDLEETVERIGAKLIDTVRIDTTHFVCTEPRGQGWEKAVEMNVPVVVPDWVKGCEREGKIVGVRGYYLDADPKLRQVGSSMGGQPRASVSTQMPHRDSPRIEHTPPTPERNNDGAQRERQFEQAQQQQQSTGPTSAPAAEPPTPPPKPDGHSSSQTSVVPPATQEAKDGEESDEDRPSTGNSTNIVGDQEDSDDDDVPEENTGPTEAVSTDVGTGQKETTDGEASRVAGEDGKFDEVAL